MIDDPPFGSARLGVDDCLVFATLAPMVPLALTMMPLEELVKTLLGVLF